MNYGQVGFGWRDCFLYDLFVFGPFLVMLGGLLETDSYVFCVIYGRQCIEWQGLIAE